MRIVSSEKDSLLEAKNGCHSTFQKAFHRRHFDSVSKYNVELKTLYNIDVLRPTACLVVNPIKVSNFAYLFGCRTVGRASD